MFNFACLAAVVSVWCAVSYFELVERTLATNITLILAVVVYLVALPFSAFFRLDRLMTWLDAGQNEPILLAGLLYVLVNFAAIGFFLGWRKERKRRLRK